MMKQEIQEKGNQSTNHMKMEKLQSNMKERVTKRYQSTSLHSDVTSAISCTKTSLANGLKSCSLKIGNCSWFELPCFDSLRYRWRIVNKGSVHSGGVFILVGRSFWWGVHSGGAFILVGCSFWWGVHSGGVFILVGRSFWWGVHSGGAFILVGCSFWWGVHSGGVFIRGRRSFDGEHSLEGIRYRQMYYL